MSDQIPTPDDAAERPDATFETVTPDDGGCCAQCECTLQPDFTVVTENASFCTGCYTALKDAVEQQVAAQTQGINWVGAVVGGLLGAFMGAGAWWLFTILTKWSFGLVAVAIGFAAGVGVVAGAGNKKARSLQVLSTLLAAVGYVMGHYWVVRTFVQREAESRGLVMDLPVIPEWGLLQEIMMNFGVMELIFLGIVLWQAWSIPNPTRLKKG